MKRSVRVIISLFMLVLALPLVYAANDPGHDVLYIEETGDSELAGNLNITQDLKVAQRLFGAWLDVRGDGTMSGTNRVVGTATNLYIESTGDIYFNDQIGVTNTVYIGGVGDNVTLSVSGDITSGGVAVCLVNGTGCIGGDQIGNVTSVIAGNGLTGGGTGDVTLTVGQGNGITVNANDVAINPTYTQRRVSGSCGAGEALTSINEDGTVNCTVLTGSSEAGGWSNTSTYTQTVLDVNISTGNLIIASGDLGIGTTAPLYDLDIRGTIMAETGLPTNLIRDPYFTDFGNWNGATGQEQIFVTLPTGESVKALRVNTTTNVQVISDYIPVDRNKTYRFSIWMSSNNTINGTRYFGVYCYNSSLTQVNCTTTSGTDHSNPYFWSGDLSPANTLRKITGYLFPENTNGWNVPNDATSANFGMDNDTAYVRLRFFNYGNDGEAVSNTFAVPRVEIVEKGDIWAIDTVSGSASYVVLTPGYNVGIGTQTPGEELYVVGNINASGDICISGGTCLGSSGGTVTSITQGTGMSFSTTPITTTGTINLNTTFTTGWTNWNTAYTHSQIAGGNSVHVSTTENTNWDTAYSQRLQWNGTSTNLDAATGRTSLGLIAGGTGDIWVEKAGDTMTGGLTIGDASGENLIIGDSDCDANGCNVEIEDGSLCIGAGGCTASTTEGTLTVATAGTIAGSTICTAANGLCNQTGLPPTGTAGGDLSGTYPNPTVNDDSHEHDAANITSGNLAIARLPTGGAWALSSDLNIDTNKLVVDNDNNRVGIMDTTPSQTLDITGNIGISGTEVISSTRVGNFAASTTVDSSNICTPANGLCNQTGLPPTGTAGGDLSGTYPNPTVNDDSHEHDAANITSGNLAIARGGTGTASTSQNYAFIGPTSGSGAPSFRALVDGDIPDTITASNYVLKTGDTMTGNLVVGDASGEGIDIGSTGVRITGDQDGAITLLGLGNGNDENLIINLDDTANTIAITTSTGVTEIDFAAIALDTTGTIDAGEYTEDGSTTLSNNISGNAATVTNGIYTTTSWGGDLGGTGTTPTVDNTKCTGTNEYLDGTGTCDTLTITGGTVTSITQGTGMSFSTTPITTTGTINLNTTFTTGWTNWNTAYTHSQATTNVHGLTFTGEGSGGGLDADTVDTIEGASLLRSDASDSYTSGTLSFNTGTTVNIDNGATFNFDRTTGTAPFTVDSTTVVTNLNANMVEGTDFGTLTNTYLCTYDSAGTEIDCNTDPSTIGSGNVTGTAGAATRVAYWSSDTEITGSSGLTFDGSLLAVTGDINASGDICISGGDCLSSVITSETDPEVGTLTSGRACYTTGTDVDCDDTFYWNSGSDYLGVGVNPSAELHVGGTTPEIRIGDAGAEDTMLLYDGNAQDFHIGLDDSADDLVIGTGSALGSSTIMTIENGGNVGIGTNNPSHTFTVAGKNANAMNVSDIFFVDGSAGEVSIGTDIPNAALEVVSTTAPQFRISYDIAASTESNGALFSVDSNSNLSIQAMRLYPSAIARTINLNPSGGAVRTGANLLVAGNVGIGTSSPDGKLHIGSDDTGDELIIGDDYWDIEDASTRILIGSNISKTNSHAVIRLGVNSSHFLNTLVADVATPYAQIQTSPTTMNLALQSSGGNVGIGTAIPSYSLHVNKSEGDGSNTQATLKAEHTITAASTDWQVGEWISSGTTHTSGTVSKLVGQYNFVNHGGTSTVTDMVGVYAWPYLASSGSATTAKAFEAAVSDGGAGSITTGYGLYINDIAGTTDYGIYQSATSDDNYFAGNVGIGEVSPGAPLHIFDSVSSTTGVVNMTLIEISSTGSTSDGWGAGIQFLMNDISEGYDRGGRIANVRDGADDDQALLLQAINSGTLVNNQLWLDSGGNVGVGIANPGWEFVVNNTAGATWLSIRSPDTSTAGILLGDQSSDTIGRIVFDNTDNSLGFYTAQQEKMRISSAGLVGIGTVSPARKLHINDTMRIQPSASPPASASAGDLYVDSTPGRNELCYYDGTSWQAIASTTDSNCA